MFSYVYLYLCGLLVFVFFFCYLLWLIAANKEYALCYKNCATFFAKSLVSDDRF